MTATTAPLTAKLIGHVKVHEHFTLGLIENIKEYLTGRGNMADNGSTLDFTIIIEDGGVHDDFDLGMIAQQTIDEVKQEILSHCIEHADLVMVVKR